MNIWSFTRKNKDGNDYTKGRVYHFPEHLEYFGYTRPLTFADGRKFCEAFRGGLVVPETDEDMLLAQSLGTALHEDFFKSGNEVETENYERTHGSSYYSLWLGIDNYNNGWSTSAERRSIVSNYWADKYRANTITVVQFNITKYDFNLNDLSSGVNRMTVYSSR